MGPAKEQHVDQSQCQDQGTHTVILAGIEAREQCQSVQYQVIDSAIWDAYQRGHLHHAAAGQQQFRSCAQRGARFAQCALNQRSTGHGTPG